MVFDIDNYYEKALKGELLNEKVIILIMLKVKDLLSNENNIINLEIPITIVGDLHGQFFDFKELLEVSGYPPFVNYLFLGDYVDRGLHGVETITLLALMKLKFKNRVNLIRGNHESTSLSHNYGFYDECCNKFKGSVKAWESIVNMFDFLPLGALINNEKFCIHGGLSPKIEKLKDINNIDRFIEPPHDGPFADLLWSDPCEEIKGFQNSERGAGYIFGKEIVEKFLLINNINHIIRAHQLCAEGYNMNFNNRLITVWSAPNYFYRMNNKATVLEIDESNELNFLFFKESKENLQVQIDEKENSENYLEIYKFLN